MRLKILSKINLLVSIILRVLSIPFIIFDSLFKAFAKPFEFVSNIIEQLAHMIGNKLLRMSYEVKSGKIKNEKHIRYATARYMYKKYRFDFY